ncbi:MAG TPA: FHA domain-containing protein [Streptosporangiaceae bacterium]|nr:FHA domain-containing protein [Streptosporangiaceae bacterium]
MEQLTTRICIEPGLGLVGRFGDTVIVIPRGDGPSSAPAAGVSPAAAGVIQELLGLAAEVGSDRQASANAIASRLAAWVIGHMSEDAPAFGIVAPMRDGVIMFLRGAVWCTITEGGATREISGEQALTWVDLIVPGTFERLAIGAAAGRPVQAEPLSDLRGGVVPGQGFVLSRVPGTPGTPGPEPAVAGSVSASEPEPRPTSYARPASEAMPEPEPERESAVEPEPAVEPGPAVAVAGGESSGFAWPPSEEMPGQAADSPPEPWALRAEVPNHQPTMVVRNGEHEMDSSRAEPGPAPAVLPTTVAPAMQLGPTAGQAPLGVLTSQDGPPIVLTGVLVLGREPQQDPAVESGEAAPVQLQDPDHVISRVHAYVSVENGIVLVRDADSMHGTYFSPPGGEQWTRIGTEPSPLPPGWSMQIGPQVFTFEPAEPDDDR